MATARAELIEYLRANNLDVTSAFLTDDDTLSSPFDTLWTEFARSHPRLSPPRSPVLSHSRSDTQLHPTYPTYIEQHSPPRTTIDLRALEYVAEYDTNLMCPICHIPFIDPIVLDCDHTFCGDCFDTYHTSVSGSDRSRCPACRAYHLGASRRANRLIRNMASEVRVKCPNPGCDVITPRSSVEMHTTRECPEQELPCPVPACERQTKRKNFVHDTCIHQTHIECDCGASIRLGRGEWIKHKDEQCPNTTNAIPQLASDTLQASTSLTNLSQCPGSEYGCTYEIPAVPSADYPQLELHISTCTFARLAPFLRKQDQLVGTLRKSLEDQTNRNQTLLSEINRMHELFTNTIQPRLDQIDNTLNQHVRNNDDTVSEIEEIPRSPSSLQHNFPIHQQLHYAQPDPVLSSTLSNLTDRLSSLENQYQMSTTDTHRAIRDLDARTSLALMNETLRIREEIAHLNGGMYSTRAQVTYLLNHHRLAGQQAALNSGAVGGASAGGIAGLARGLSNSLNNTGGSNSAQPAQSSSAATQSQSQSYSQSQNYNYSDTSPQPVMATLAGSSTSAGTSPVLTPLFNSNTRPNLRRGSGGSGSGSRSSVDRVKL